MGHPLSLWNICWLITVEDLRRRTREFAAASLTFYSWGPAATNKEVRCRVLLALQLRTCGDESLTGFVGGVLAEGLAIREAVMQSKCAKLVYEPHEGQARPANNRLWISCQIQKSKLIFKDW